MYKHNGFYDNEFGKNFDVKIWHPTDLDLSLKVCERVIMSTMT